MAIPTVKFNDKTFLQIAMELGDNPESLSEYTASANVRPTVLVEDTITRANEDIRNDIMQAHLTLYAGWYLQASIHRLDVGGVKIRELLNPLSTDPSIRNSVSIAIEFVDPSTVLSLDSLSMEDKQSSGSDMSRPSNLAVGKSIDVPLTVEMDDDKSYKVTVPVNIILSPRSADIDFLLELFSHLGKDQGWLERFHRYSAGEIKSLTDYVFALDIIREERKLMVKDSEGTYTRAKERRSKGLLSTLLSGKKAINIASAITIITKESAGKLERAMRGRKLTNAKDRHAYFVDTGSMILSIVDMQRERLTVYTRGVDEASVYTFRDIKGMGTNPGAGMDIGTVVSALRSGGMPQF